MRNPCYPLRRAEQIRSRRPQVFGRFVVLAVAAAILLLQGAPLTRHDEIAQADPLPAERSAPRAVRATPILVDKPVAAVPPMLGAPANVITCAQPPVGSFLAVDGTGGCMRRTLDGAGPDEAAAIASGTVSAAAGPASPDRLTRDRPTRDRATPPSVVAAGQPSVGPAPVTLAPPSLPATSFPSGPVTTASLAPPMAVPEMATAAEPAGSARASTTPLQGRVAALDRKLTGKWVPRTNVCAKRDGSGECITLVIKGNVAKAGSASCRFADLTRSGDRWKMLAQCENNGESWTAHVRLVMAGNRLTWTSERGTQVYMR